MTQRRWFPTGADQYEGTLLPRCEDPPTQALALEAATDVAGQPEEDAGGRKVA